jgi:hypothetical protein
MATTVPSKGRRVGGFTATLKSGVKQGLQCQTRAQLQGTFLR